MPIDDVAARGFQAGAAAYESARPGYPDEAIATLGRELEVAAGTMVCDLAAGTGKLTRRLVEMGASVVAVEPVEGMRAQARASVPEAQVVDGTAEAIPLPDGSVDVVTVAQAFHWFDADVALAEIARVLKPGGGLALLWNERDEGTAWVAEMSRLIRWHERTVSRYQHVDWADVVAAAGGFTALEEESLRWEQPMTRDILADRVRSISYIAVMPPAERERLAAEVTALVTRLPEPFALPYVCRVPVVPAALTDDRRAAVLGWWTGQRRDLPWRQTRDPWEVLVCEVMAQQTQVARVAERWRPFLDRFPTPAALAVVPVAEVVRCWSGLGYNRRARNLHRCAQTVVADHDGRLPGTLEALLALPGVGPYTARAVLAFAFELDHGVVDTNTARVLARWAGHSLRPAAAQEAADASVPPGQAWAWNQAMLDLGAGVCRRRDPRCGECPVATCCSWARAGRPAPDPADGSAGVSGGQSRFEGSDRQGRGRLVEALRHAPVPAEELAVVMGWPDDPTRAARVAATLVEDGLVRAVAGGYRLA